MKKKEIVKLSKYDELRYEVEEAAYKEISKIHKIQIISFIVGIIIAAVFFITRKEIGSNYIWGLFAGLIVAGIGKEYKSGTINRIEKELKEKLRTIQDQELRDNLRAKE